MINLKKLLLYLKKVLRVPIYYIEIKQQKT